MIYEVWGVTQQSAVKKETLWTIGERCLKSDPRPSAPVVLRRMQNLTTGDVLWPERHVVQLFLSHIYMAAVIVTSFKSRLMESNILSSHESI
jgi:hypothetical protein